MTEQSRKILEEALALPPMERAALAEGILSSFDAPERRELDAAWAKEAEERITGYEHGELQAFSVTAVFDHTAKQQE